MGVHRQATTKQQLASTKPRPNRVCCGRRQLELHSTAQAIQLHHVPHASPRHTVTGCWRRPCQLPDRGRQAGRALCATGTCTRPARGGTRPAHVGRGITVGAEGTGSQAGPSRQEHRWSRCSARRAGGLRCAGEAGTLAGRARPCLQLKVSSTLKGKQKSKGRYPTRQAVDRS